MLLNMISISNISKTKRILPIDISIGSFNREEDSDGNPVDEDKYNVYLGTFNEDDMTIYDPMYASKGAFYQALNSALAKHPADLFTCNRHGAAVIPKECQLLAWRRKNRSH